MEERERFSLRFPKEDRLHHRSLVEGLFRFGKSFYEFPFRVTWRCIGEEELQKNFRNAVPKGIGRVQIMVTVPKKKRRRAVDRVLMRRRIREAYRLHRHSLMEKVGSSADIRSLSLALVYIHDKNIPYVSIEEKLLGVLNKLQKRLETSELQSTTDHLE